MKRRLSTSESASSTPVPGDALSSSLHTLPHPVSFSTPVSTRVSPEVVPERASASTTPAPGREERTVAKLGQIVPGSGDGTAHGAECFLWTDLPMNKTGFRYAPCAPSPVISPAPHFPFYRTIPGAPPAPPVAISWVDRSAFLRISQDALTVTTDRGFRSGRGTVSAREGTWYYEAIIERGDGAGGGGKATGGDSGNPHVRIGWGRREAGLDAPVGADAYAYSIRDVGGEKVHISRPKPYGRSFGTGDVVGCLIHLPPRQPVSTEEEAGYVRRWRVPLRYKGQLYFEMDEYPVAKEMEALVNREGKPPAPVVHEEEKKVVKKTGASTTAPENRSRTLETLPGSYVAFFLNGEPLGTAFTDLYDFLPLPPLPGKKKKFSHAYEREREAYQYHDDGTLGYFPMVSCFGRGKVRLNFGPQWVKPPHLPPGTRPMCDRWDEFRAEELVLDERDEVALAERLVKDMAAAAEAKARPVPLPKRKDKKRKKGTPAPGEDTPGGTPRDGMTPFTPGPGSSPPAMPFDNADNRSAASTPAPYEPDVPVKIEAGIDIGENPDADADADVDADAEGEDANEGIVWD